MKEARKERVRLITYGEREVKKVGDGEELFGNKGERLEVTMIVILVSVVVDEESEDTYPTIIR